ncbi:hypothetical protein XJ44_04025 [Thermosipho affectus]|uniref:TIGR02221 family CRISPR-associated protein n=1 Tax=Thermosipho affectus TaxID=660294 RepID=A0ABX3IHS2_9BACT|nr:TM1812 family CRISPR-associated protein [Thermosipho affectus]ONN27363.1 hypothetical protein XJ44_04025 [Thermosipho affectus]
MEIIFFLTKDAKSNENWIKHAKPELKRKNVHYDVIDISEEISIKDFLKEILRVIDENDEVEIDITHAFRWFPMVLLVADMYLKEAKNSKITGIWYGEYYKDKDETRALNKVEVLEFTEWLYAAKLFKEYAYTKSLASLIKVKIKEEKSKNGKFKKDIKKLNDLRKNLERLSFYLRLGSVEELKKNINNLVECLNNREFLYEIEEFIPELSPQKV